MPFPSVKNRFTVRAKKKKKKRCSQLWLVLLIDNHRNGKYTTNIVLSLLIFVLHAPTLAHSSTSCDRIFIFFIIILCIHKIAVVKLNTMQCWFSNFLLDFLNMVFEKKSLTMRNRLNFIIEAWYAFVNESINNAIVNQSIVKCVFAFYFSPLWFLHLTLGHGAQLDCF